MSRSSSATTTTTTSGGGGGSSSSKKLKGVRRRKWGKWVSEIRVPRTQERLWLGTYATPEAAAAAHDVAVYCLRRPSSLEKLNFPETLSSYSVFLHHQQQQNRELSPRSVQKVASDVAMDVDARNIANNANAGGGRAEATVAAESSCHERGNRSDNGDGTSVYTNNNNNNVGGGVDDSSWWDDLGGTCHGEGEALSISIEDYL